MANLAVRRLGEGASSAVRSIWRSLPRGRRQELFAALTQFGLSPAKGRSDAGIRTPIVVVGPLAAPTGIGQAARLVVHALRAAGVPYGTFDVTSRLMQPSTESFPASPASRGEGTLLVYVTPPNCGHVLRAVPKEIRRGKMVAAGWVCETTALPSMWRRQAKLFDMVAAPSRFAADAIEEAVGKRVLVVGHPVDSEPLPSVAARRDRGTRRTIGAVFDVGSSGDRKNVAGLIACIEAIVERSGEVDFHLKVRDLGSDPVASRSLDRLSRKATDRIQLVRSDDSRAETIAFLDRLDLLLSFSRAEGFALPYAEAIMRGVRVAAPRWGGPVEFLTDGNSIALPFRLVPIQDRSGLYSPDMGEWADVDPLVAADLVLADLDEPRPVAPALPPLCTTDFFIRALGLRLPPAVPGDRPTDQGRAA